MKASASRPVEEVATKLVQSLCTPLGGLIQFFGSLAAPPSTGIIARPVSKTACVLTDMVCFNQLESQCSL